MPDDKPQEKTRTPTWIIITLIISIITNIILLWYTIKLTTAGYYILIVGATGIAAYYAMQMQKHKFNTEYIEQSHKAYCHWKGKEYRELKDIMPRLTQFILHDGANLLIFDREAKYPHIIGYIQGMAIEQYLDMENNDIIGRDIIKKAEETKLFDRLGLEKRQES